MSDTEKSFVALALDGEVLMDEIDNYVDKWHEGDSHLLLHEFLGMTCDEYSLWLDSPDALGLILAGRKLGRTLEDIANDNMELTRMAARSNASVRIKTIQRWLENRHKASRATS